MEGKRIRSAEEIIRGCEAEGLKFLGSFPLPESPADSLNVDQWEESARKRNAMLMHVYTLGQCFVFEKGSVYNGPRTKKAYVRAAA